MVIGAVKTVGTTVKEVGKTAESLALGIRQGKRDFSDAVASADSYGMFQSSVTITQGYVSAPYYALMGISYLPTPSDTSLLTLFEKYVLDPLKSIHWGVVTVANLLAALGLIIAVFSLIDESLSYRRQQQLLTCLADLPDSHTSPDDKEKLKKALQSLSEVNPNHLLRSLPDHFKKQLQTLEEKNRFNIFDEYLLQIDQDQPVNAFELLHAIRTGIQKKQKLYVIGIIAAICSIIGSIGVIVAFPPLLIIFFSLLGVGLLIARYIISSGWVENPKEGLNWGLCIPEALCKKLGIDVDTDLETESKTILSFEEFLRKNTYGHPDYDPDFELAKVIVLPPALSPEDPTDSEAEPFEPFLKLNIPIGHNQTLFLRKWE